MSRRVLIDRELCIGSGDCVRIAPAAFRLDEEMGVSVALPLSGKVDPGRLLDAAATCPTGAITVSRDGDER